MTFQEQPPAIRGQSKRALRLTFSYTGRRVRLVERQALEMSAPPSDPVYDFEGQSGFWCELRDANDRLLYRRIVHNPIAFELEAPSGDPVRPFTRQADSRPQGLFSLVVPDLGEARSLALVSSPLEPGKAAEPAERLASFNLRARRGGQAEDAE